MSESKKMIEIINQNRNKVYEIRKQNLIKEKARKAMISDLIGVGLEIIGFAAFVEVICLIITR